MRRALAAGLLLAIAAAAPARAAEPVVGGLTFNDAPILSPGSYSDSVDSGGTLVYAVRLGRGQTLNAAASLDVSGIDASLTGASSLMVKLYDPLRQQASQGQALGPGDATTHLKDTSASAGPVARAGTYYISVAVNDFLQQRGARTELPLELKIGVRGAPSRHTARARPAPGPGGGTSWGVFAALCAGGAAAGALGGIVLRRR